MLLPSKVPNLEAAFRELLHGCNHTALIHALPMAFGYKRVNVQQTSWRVS
jgi:hypothetical protein